jgi:dihydrodipicolinate synthase/N-acetylneuraminate lyase
MDRGVYSVISTPLDEHENIDNVVFEREINWLIQCGVKGLVLAMVSEVMRFSADERRIQWQSVLKIIDKRVPLIVSVGGESTCDSGTASEICRGRWSNSFNGYSTI